MEKDLKASQSSRKGFIKKYRFRTDTYGLFYYKYHTMIFEEQERLNRVLSDYEKYLISKYCELQVYSFILRKG